MRWIYAGDRSVQYTRMVPLTLHIRPAVFDLVQSNMSQLDTRRTKTPMWHSLRLQTGSSISKITTSIYIWWGVGHDNAGCTCTAQESLNSLKNTIQFWSMMCMQIVYENHPSKPSSIWVQLQVSIQITKHFMHLKYQVHMSTSSVWVCSLQAGRACGNTGCTCTTSQQVFMNGVICSTEQDYWWQYIY